MNRLILTPRFIDRAGRTVFDMHEEKVGSRYLMADRFIGQMRMDMVRLDDENISFETVKPLKKVDSGVESGGTG